jgi:protocatechuate 3,4-dioxygenase beta subunit
MITRRIVLAGVAAIPLAQLNAGRRIRPDAGSRCLAGPCASAKSSISIADANEPGKRMIVSGQVFKPDGRTPAPGVIMYVYHTDDTGEIPG